MLGQFIFQIGAIGLFRYDFKKASTIINENKLKVFTMMSRITQAVVLFAVALVVTYTITANLAMSACAALMISLFHCCMHWVLSDTISVARAEKKQA